MSLSSELRRAGWMKPPRVGSSGSMRRTRGISLGSKILLAAGLDPDMELAAMWLPCEKDGELILRIVPFDDVLRLAEKKEDVIKN